MKTTTQLPLHQTVMFEEFGSISFCLWRSMDFFGVPVTEAVLALGSNLVATVVKSA
jgi:hypothetical protein